MKKNNGALIFADWPPSHLDAEEIKKYFAAGFTHMLMTEDFINMRMPDGTLNDGYFETIKSIQKYGSVMACNHGFSPDNYDDITTEFSDLGICNFYYADEPDYKRIDQYVKMVDWHNKNNSGGLFHINLLPSYGTYGEHGASTYKEYLQYYADTILTKVQGRRILAVDHYPLMDDYTLAPNYLSDLLTVAHIVKEFNQKFPSDKAEASFCIQTYGRDTRRVPESVADIRFQTNTVIAMGAHCFEIYEYRGSEFESGIMQIEHAYEWVKCVNQEIRAWDEVFTSYQWNNSRMYGDDDCILCVRAKEQLAECFETGIEILADQSVLVSEFVDEDSKYAYMAVNATEPSKGETVNVSMKFEGQPRQVIVYKNGKQEICHINQLLGMELAPGDAVFCIPVY